MKQDPICVGWKDSGLDLSGDHDRRGRSNPGCRIVGSGRQDVSCKRHVRSDMGFITQLNSNNKQGAAHHHNATVLLSNANVLTLAVSAV